MLQRCQLTLSVIEATGQQEESTRSMPLDADDESVGHSEEEDSGADDHQQQQASGSAVPDEQPSNYGNVRTLLKYVSTVAITR